MEPHLRIDFGLKARIKLYTAIHFSSNFLLTARRSHEPFELSRPRHKQKHLPSLAAHRRESVPQSEPDGPLQWRQKHPSGRHSSAALQHRR